MNKLDNRLLYFNIDDEEFALKLSFVSEIFEVNMIENHPSKSDTIIGITDIRDDVIILIDTKKILFEENTWTKEKCMDKQLILLNLEQTNKDIGLIVDSVNKVDKIETQDIDSTVFTEDNTVEGVFKRDDGEIIPVLDIQNIQFT